MARPETYPWSTSEIGAGFAVPYDDYVLQSLRVGASRQYVLYGRRFDVRVAGDEIVVVRITDPLADLPWLTTGPGRFFFVPQSAADRRLLAGKVRILRSQGIEYRIHPDLNRWALERIT